MKAPHKYTIAMIYLDYAATTPVDPRVIQVMHACLQDPLAFANPSSLQHAYGRHAHDKIESAREQLARALRVASADIVWVSGATEANNLAIMGFALANQHRGRHVITLKTEHKSVLDSYAALAKCGFRVTLLPVDGDGVLDLGHLRQALTPDTILVSVMAVNNETGVQQDISAIAELVHAHGARLHVDAVQAFGKMPLDLVQWGVDLASISAHKIYGPKGVGALYVKRDPRLKLQALSYGGAQERQWRAGTLATHQVCGFAAAAELAVQEPALAHIEQLNAHLQSLLATIPSIQIHSINAPRVPHILNCAVQGVEGQRLLARVNDAVAVSNGSACNVHTHQPSHVLLAQGVPLALAQASLRFSLGKMTTLEELNRAVAHLRAVLQGGR
jgi:cysteine desulfurase